MEIEIIDEGKKAEEMKADCCLSDIWAISLPE